jgi:hypothetical protein
MQLIEIDKEKYKKNFRVVFAGIAVALLVIALASSTILIHLFGDPGVSNFWLNLTGVIIAAITVAYVLNKLRNHPYMHEVVYVWDLKQQLNRIHRKQMKIEKEVENGNRDAMIIMNYFYRGSKQLYELDDNTITMDTLSINMQLLEKKMEALGMDPSTDAYSPEMLDDFK